MNRPYFTVVAAWLARLNLALASMFFSMFFLLPCEAQVPRAPYAFPPRSNPSANSNIRITYGGNIIMDLGNYDVVFGPPLPLGPELPDGGQVSDGSGVSTSPQIIYKGDSGLRWDGRTYVYHPAYPYDIVARYHYENRVVGRGEEQYPPLLQDEWKVQGRRFGVGEERTAALLPFGQITPAPLPGAENLPEICRRYPYAIQCRPAWVQQPDFGDLRGRFAAPDGIAEPSEPQPPVKPETTPPSRPPIAIPRPSPIILLGPEGTDECAYELLSPRGNYAYTLAPGQKHVIRADRDWRIRFDSNGMGVKTYWLRSGKTYRFSKNQSDVWQLRWLRKPRETSKAAATPEASP